jgi:aryl-alcohol dehydrogenase-like predicted oxidoreductase
MNRYFRFKRTGKRNEIFLASKFGFCWDQQGGAMARGDRVYVKEAANRALEKLDVDMIDLYYLHR